MEYYHDLVTQQSWEELQALNKHIDFILIGGWAVYLYTKQLKSKDIDIIVDYSELPKLEKSYSLSKNERLKKYEAVKDQVQIDIYLPFFSDLGLPVDRLRSEFSSIEGFKVLDANYLMVLKIYTLSQRGRTPKGSKDLLDIVSLMVSGTADKARVVEILNEHNLGKEKQTLKHMLNESLQLPELNLNTHQFSKVKKAWHL